jgi:urease subunit beta
MASRKTKVQHDGDSIEINAGRPTATLKVTNTGDRPLQIGSHFHFFEVNPAMRFEREKAWGMHLDIAAGTGVRFEPGETKQVTLVAYAGARRLVGFNGLVNGGLDAERTKADAMRRLADRGFENGPPDSKVSGATAATTKKKSATEKGSK